MTLAHGVYDPADGGVVLALAVIQRCWCVTPTARIKTVAAKPGLMIGCARLSRFTRIRR